MFKIILFSDIDGLLTIKEHWDRLALETPTCRLTQTYDWAAIAWQERKADPRDQLICATVWQRDRLVGVWPILVRAGRLIRTANLLGCSMGEEYGEPLIALDVDQTEVCRLLVSELNLIADCLYIYCVPEGSAIEQVLSSSGVIRIPAPLMSYSIDWNKCGNFDALYSAYSSKFKQTQKSRRRKFVNAGAHSFELVTDRASKLETIDWILSSKQEWVRRRNINSTWLFMDSTRAFFHRAADIAGPIGQLGLFRLTSNGSIISAFLMTMDRERMEGFIMTYDPNYSHFSPSMLLLEDCARWAAEKKLNIDMRPLHLDYKERWSNQETLTIIYDVALTWRGAVVLAPKFLKYKVRTIAKRVLPAGLHSKLRMLVADIKRRTERRYRPKEQ